MTPRGRKPYGPRTDVKPLLKGKRPLREARLMLGLTQQQAATACHVSLSTWQQWERNSRQAPGWWEDLMKLNAEKVKEPHGTPEKQTRKRR